MKYITIMCLACLLACTQSEKKSEVWELDTQSYRLGGVGAFSEVITAGIKNLALSAPMTAAEMEAIFELAKAKAATYNVEVWVDTDFLVTDLFDEAFTKDKHVMLMYQGDTKDKYQQLKADKQALIDANEYTGEKRLEIALHMGKLLSYSDRRIEELLANNKMKE